MCNRSALGPSITLLRWVSTGAAQAETADDAAWGRTGGLGGWDGSDCYFFTQGKTGLFGNTESWSECQPSPISTYTYSMPIYTYTHIHIYPYAQIHIYTYMHITRHVDRNDLDVKVRYLCWTSVGNRAMMPTSLEPR